MRQLWNAEAQAAELELQHPQANPRAIRSDSGAELACQLVRDAVEHNGNERASFRLTSLQKYVLSEIQPFNLAELEAAIEGFPGLIKTVGNRYTTSSAKEQERRSIRLIRHGQNSVAPLVAESDINVYLKNHRLSPEQLSAIRIALGTSDRFVAWVGAIGDDLQVAIGHTQTLAETLNYTAKRCVIPRAKTDICKLPIYSSSVQDNTLWIVEAADRLNAADACKLLERVAEQNARALLIGQLVAGFAPV
ncbi:MAG: hypothetical protein AAGE92_17045 [Cyanobacteria bacterium P01_G01_bin.4]